MLMDPWGVTEQGGDRVDARPGTPVRPGLARRRIGWGLVVLCTTAVGAAVWIDYGQPYRVMREVLAQARSQRAGANAGGAKQRAPGLMETARKAMERGEDCIERWRFKEAKGHLEAAAHTYALASEVSTLAKEWERVRGLTGGVNDANLNGPLARFDAAYRRVASGSEAVAADVRKELDESGALLRELKTRVAVIESSVAARRHWERAERMVHAAREAQADVCFAQEWTELVGHMPVESAAGQALAVDLIALTKEFALLRDRAVAASLEAQQARKEMEAARQTGAACVDNERRAALADADQKARGLFGQGRFVEARQAWKNLAATWRQEEGIARTLAAIEQALAARDLASQVGAADLARREWQAGLELLREAEEQRDRLETGSAITKADAARQAFIQCAQIARAQRDGNKASSE